MAVLQSLKPDEWEKLYEGADGLDQKEASILNKYYIACMSLLSKKDSKAASLCNYPMLLKGQIKMN